MTLPMAEQKFQELLRHNEYVSFSHAGFSLVLTQHKKYAEKPVQSGKLKEAVATAPPDFGALYISCGGSNFTEDDVRKVLAKRAPEHAASIKNKVYGRGIEASITEDFAKLKAWPFFPETAKIGSYVYDLDSGVVSEVLPENFEAGNL
ncbi:hypothetical protein MPH_11326 [Macrophomina phaseolina MS6]|uniref:Uncharacterized protein n=1 Tax=Macrophomina phaseolina (strain MS6) TaxID=1126212 RepID=K2S504_MACPH|nr:hypothetical protein MPH_11326 [Macrophomina phaseolina MS6]